MDGARDERRLRASDADRDKVADVLRSAAADGRLTLTELEERLDALYAAKTYAELEPVVDDLPGTLDILRGAPPTSVQPVAGTNMSRVGGTPTSRVAKAVFSGVRRRGQWVVPGRYLVKAVFGGVDLDLRRAQLEEREVTIDIRAVFGGVRIIVPEDMAVVIDGSGVFGAFAGDAEDEQPPPGAPVVRVTGKAVFGGVSAERKAA